MLASVAPYNFPQGMCCVHTKGFLCCTQEVSGVHASDGLCAQISCVHTRDFLCAHKRSLVCTQEISCVYTREIFCEKTIMHEHRCVGCWAPNPAQHPTPPGRCRMLGGLSRPNMRHLATVMVYRLPVGRSGAWAARHIGLSMRAKILQLCYRRCCSKSSL